MSTIRPFKKRPNTNTDNFFAFPTETPAQREEKNEPAHEWSPPTYETRKQTPTQTNTNTNTDTDTHTRTQTHRHTDTHTHKQTIKKT